MARIQYGTALSLPDVPTGSLLSTDLSLAQARRVALAAQGFAGARPKAVTRARIADMIAKIHVLQLDSVSVSVRAHYAPLFSRLGSYDRALLDDAAWASPHRLVEYWAHEAALIAVEDWPLMRWRMDEFRNGRWRGVQRVMAANPGLAQDIVAIITERGAMTAGGIEKALLGTTRGAKGPWWDRSDTKHVAEALFARGDLSCATRVAFSRYYDLSERVVPAPMHRAQISEADAVRALIAKAATALGVATEPDLRDYFRLRPAQSKAAVAELVEAGELELVQVEGWRDPAYLAAGTTIPRATSRTALLCPFDPLIFFRPRTERLFGFHYRLEIYTPAAQRVHGYYVWPYLRNGVLVGRVDLKTDRTAGALRVLATHAEPGVTDFAEVLSADLAEMARWLDLDHVEVADRGDAAGSLRCAVARLEVS